MNSKRLHSQVKKAAAILLLIIFLFNWFGYRLLSGYLQHRSDTHLEARFDQHQYNEASLIELRIPLNMPYQNGNSDFERYDGETEHNGIHYKYVKRKVENGYLVLLCLPNENRMQLQNARDEFFKLVNDLQHGPEKSDAPVNIIKSPVTEYWHQLTNWHLEVITALRHQYTTYAAFFPSSPMIGTPAQPPEFSLL